MITNLTQLPIPKLIGYALEALPRKQFSDYGLDNNLTYAGICLEKTGEYTLILGDRFWDLTPQEQSLILIHEYQHIACGHALLCKQLNLNPGLFNIATDAWINEVQPHAIVQALKSILYTELREGMPAKPPCKEYPEGIPARDPIDTLPQWLPDPVEIYRHIKDKVDQTINEMDKLMVGELTQEGVGKAGLESLRARAIIREVAKEHEEYRKLAEEFNASYSGASHLYKEVKVAEWLNALYTQIERLAKDKSGNLLRRRGWHRPGRFEGYAGISRRPSLNVMIALDVSGSTAGWWDDIIAACRGITRKHEVEIVCHSDKIVFQGKAVPLDAPVGDGTLFEPVTSVATRKNPDCLLWVTDGESADHPTLPTCPVYWVWLPGSRKWPLREQDFQTEYGS